MQKINRSNRRNCSVKKEFYKDVKVLEQIKVQSRIRQSRLAPIS
jgi:hypothetical protein